MVVYFKATCQILLIQCDDPLFLNDFRLLWWLFSFKWLWIIV